VRIWARVRVRDTAVPVAAARDLKAGQRIEASDLRVETAAETALTLATWTGKRLRRAVRAGEPLRPEWVETPPDVGAGDTVRVEVRSGAARLAFEGRAQTSGNAGQTVAVLNTQTRRRFQARVMGPGCVSVEGSSL
jgi:flagella basal body P-ring formation protein FlgA